MEFDLLNWNSKATSSLILLPLLIFFFFFFVKKWKKSKTIIRVNLPPGPKKLQIIGNLHLITNPTFRCFAELAKQYGPIMHLKLGEVDTVIVSSPEIAKQVFKDKDPIFTDRPESIALKILWYNYADIAFAPYGEYWRQMRRICILELLSARSVKSFASIRKDEVSRMVESICLSSGEPVNLTERVFSMMSSVSCRAAFGKVRRDKDSLIKLMSEGLDMAGGFSIADIFPSSWIAHALSFGNKVKLKRMRRKTEVILDDIIHEHERNRGPTERGSASRRGNGEFGSEDLVDVLLRVKESGEMEFPIGYDNIKAVLFDIFVGGTETSSSTVDWAMAELMRNPQVMVKAQAEIRQVAIERNNTGIEEEDVQMLNYLKLVIMETLRLYPPGTIIPRVSREACQINGYTIPPKMKVLVNVWAIHTDPKYWNIDPESFIPERFLDEPSLDMTGNDPRYWPFGSGKRMCPGMAFGLASVALPLAQLLLNFDWELPAGVGGPRGLNMMESSALATSRKEKLMIINCNSLSTLAAIPLMFYFYTKIYVLFIGYFSVIGLTSLIRFVIIILCKTLEVRSARLYEFIMILGAKPLKDGSSGAVPPIAGS